MKIKKRLNLLVQVKFPHCSAYSNFQSFIMQGKVLVEERPHTKTLEKRFW